MEYYAGKKRKRIGRPILLILLATAVLLVSFLAVMRPLAIDAAVYRGKVMITRFLQETVIETLTPGISYDELIEIKTGDDGRATALKIDSARISMLQATLTKSVNDQLTNWSTEKTTLPLGTLTGIWIFNGQGPKVNFYTAPVSAVNSEIHHRFESAGINQTRHCVELEVSVDAQTLILGARTPFNVSTKIVLSDTVIVGVTPEIFAGIASGGAGINQ